MCTYGFHFEQLDSSGELYLSEWLPLQEPHYVLEEVFSKNIEGLPLSAPPQGQLGGSTVPLQLFGALGGSSHPSRLGSEGSLPSESTAHGVGVGAFQWHTHMLEPEQSAIRVGQGGMG